MPAGTVENLFKPKNNDQLAAILSYHVFPRKLPSNMLPHKRIHVRTIKSDGDRLLSASKSSNGVTVDEANVIDADIKADNGVVPIIDKVMLPKSGCIETSDGVVFLQNNVLPGSGEMLDTGSTLVQPVLSTGLPATVPTLRDLSADTSAVDFVTSAIARAEVDAE